MMDSIRRRLSETTGDPWALDSSLNPETQESSEIPLDNTVLLTRHPLPPSNDVDMKEYYKGVIRTAIRHGGWYQRHLIPIPWLRMTLAGLEMRPIPAETMWEGAEGSAYSEMPDYGEIFPEAEPDI